MPIAQSRLIEIQNDAARGFALTFIPSDELLDIVNELIVSRDRFGPIAGGAAADLDMLRKERVKLQDENQELRASLDRRLTALEDRVTQVADIIGERIAGIDGQLAVLRDMFDRAETRTVNVLDKHSTDIAALKFPDGEKQDGAAFPTGGADTAEAAAEAVLPVPVRGDRVRLEGAYSVGHTHIIDGWYDVLGQDTAHFQVAATGLSRLWVANDHPGLKEVRHADHT